MKSSNAIIGIVAGIALGATLGVLFAPSKGDKTRRKIASKTKENKDSLKHGFDEFLDSVSATDDSFKHNGEELLKKDKVSAEKENV